MADPQLPHIYSDLAPWFHLLTAPEDYEEEAAFYLKTIRENIKRPLRTILELGSGGGNNASHMKAHATMTLTDLSPAMLGQSRTINPELEHIEGDMRTVRLDRLFDAVFVHDAVGYMISEADLRAAIETAFVHCEPGGVAIFAPDYIREHFQPGTDHGGNDGPNRKMRFLEWVHAPSGDGRTYEVDYVCLLYDGSQPPVIVHDHHLEGLFARDEWLTWLSEAGFEPHEVPFDHSEIPQQTLVVFAAVKP